MKIPFNVPHITGKEVVHVSDAISEGRISSGGEFSKKVTTFISNFLGSRKTFFTSSCSAALDASAIILGLEKGDEVIMPSFTFASTANAVVARGARPVFVDIDPETFNIDPECIKSAISNKTKAIYPVHYAGVSCDMDAISFLASKHDLKIVEDAAQAFLSTYRGEYAGSFGNMSCFSFHESKNFSCGEGGCLAINDPSMVEAADIVVEKGTDRTKFLRGEVDKYTWKGLGSSYLGSDLAAAYLWAQIEESDKILKERRSVFFDYCDFLRSADLLEKGDVVLPSIPWDRTSNFHIFSILVKSEKIRDDIVKKMNERGIQVTTHYVPLHTSPFGKSLGYKEGDLPITESVASRIIRLPIYPGLTDVHVKFIVDALEEIMK